MKIKVKGEMSLVAIRQALFEKLCELEEEYFVRFSAGATLYLNPTNGFGDDIIPVTRSGREITILHSSGPYRSAADEYNL